MSGYFGIPLRNGLPLGLGTVISLRSGASWTPLTLFLAGEQGGWYDPTDLTTMFQDSAGTTPVTAVEQPVGLWLDKRLGALSALGAELVTNGDFATNTWWSLNAGWTIGSGVATHPTGAEGYILSPSGTTTLGKTYRVSFTVVSLSGGNVLLAFGPGSFTTIAAAGSYSFLLTAANDTRIGFYAGTAVSVSIDNVSVREVPGNHLIQPTSASRPTYSKRYNLLNATENFSTVWNIVNSTINTSASPPSGSSVATKLIPTAAFDIHYAQQSVTRFAGTYRYAFKAKPDGYNFIAVQLRTLSGSFIHAQYRLDNATVQSSAGGTATATALSDGYVYCVFDFDAGTGASSANDALFVGSAAGNWNTGFSGNGVSGVIVSAVDLRRTIHTQMGMPAYQRVTTATGYDETGFLPRLRFDGADDSMYTAASVDFSATDEMTVLAGLTKLSDAVGGWFVELSAELAANNGTFLLQLPSSAAANNVRFTSKGTIPREVNIESVPGPVTRVVTGLGDIGGDVAQIRSNGVVVGTSTSDQGTGNFGNYVLYVGRRNNASLPFNGDIFQLIVRGALTSGADLTSAEQYVAARTGVVI